LALAFDAEPDIEVVGTATTAAELTQLCEAHRPDVVLLEADATEWDACRLVAALRKRHRALRVIGTYAQIDRANAMRAYQAGFRTLVARANGMSAVAAAVRATLTRADVVSMPTLEHRQAEPAGNLTSREIDVLSLVGSGFTTREISVKLGISPKTVENHKQRIFSKLGVQNQAHAVAVALRSGVLQPAAALEASVNF
jgi:DNA-binding NarL/FixJ family response regulator